MSKTWQRKAGYLVLWTQVLLVRGGCHFLRQTSSPILAVMIAREQNVIDIVTSSNRISPDHSTPTFVSGNLCGFRRTDGFTPSPSENPMTWLRDARAINPRNTQELVQGEKCCRFCLLCVTTEQFLLI